MKEFDLASYFLVMQIISSQSALILIHFSELLSNELRHKKKAFQTFSFSMHDQQSSKLALIHSFLWVDVC